MKTFILLIFIVISSSCGGKKPISDPMLGSTEPLFTMVNMRFDENRNSISSIGYQKFRLLSVCTPVILNAVFQRSFEFTLKDTGRRIHYDLNKRTQLPVQAHLNRLIGPQCPATESLSENDQQGIKEGKALNGMTREGVLIAVGYPPEHRTGNLDNTTWTYWNSTFGSFALRFDNNGLVTGENVAPPTKVAAKTVYTLVNLHANKRGEIESIGYQKLGMLPICTPVEIVEMDSDEIEFINKDNGINYVFSLHDTNQVSIAKHRERIFGENCIDQSAMSEIDKTGIEQGKAMVGMTKEGVVAALGYPPEHETPSIRGNKWVYWIGRVDKFVVSFKNDLVVSIKD